MRLVEKFIGSGTRSDADADVDNARRDSLTDEALDTLSRFLRILGSESFPLDVDVEPAIFTELCNQFAGHVENGGPVPAFGISRAPDGAREWSQVRTFFTDRRRAEKGFVVERLDSYRDVVEELLAGLRTIGERDQTTASQVKERLVAVETAVSKGDLTEIRQALSSAVEGVTTVFAEQERQYQTQLGELNKRMSNLKQDLVAAREEMKRDALTDAYNRGAFDSAIEQSLNLHFILDQPVTVVLIDVDHFKQVNDTYGHAAGDQVLRAIGGALDRAFIRKGDLVARYGGDEFAVILNDTSAEIAARLVDRFLENASNIEVPEAAGDRLVSCSAGYTEIHDSDTVESLIRRADKALYAAKAAGRNTARSSLFSDTEN